LSGIFQGPLGQIIAPHVSAKKLAKLVDEYMGFQQFSFIKDHAAIFEGKETQALMNQASSSLEGEAAQPIEENMVGNA
jgi:hypothetical protein